MATEPVRAVKIFYCYAHEDKPLRDELEKHLGALKRSGKITTWYDREIQPGTDWEREIEARLDTADVILLLVSPDFMHSDYCYGVEMDRAQKRHDAGIRVVPVILRPVLWRDTPISKFQLLPMEGKPITVWPDRDAAFQDVAEGIYKVVEELRVRWEEQERARKAEEQRVQKAQEVERVRKARWAEEERTRKAEEAAQKVEEEQVRGAQKKEVVREVEEERAQTLASHDEQIIYLSPEEELINVRERLERAQAQHIILVMPPQTQLRSQVGWRLLHARARELGKDVLVISSDRQIRAVVKAAGFRLESFPSDGTLPGSRPGRTGASGRTRTPLRDFVVSDQRPALQENEGDIVQPSPLPGLLDEEMEIDSPHTYDRRPRNNRQSISPEEIESEDALPPVTNRPARPVDSTAQSGARSPTRITIRSLTTIPRGSLSAIPILLTVLILFLIAVLAYGYFVPSADVIITIPAQNFNTPLALTATASSKQDATHQTVRAQTLVFDKTLTATGHATGSKQVGTTPATGNVLFTNHGSQSVDIPTGTIVATNSGVQFATTKDTLVPAVGNSVGNTIPIPVQAQSLGTSGNVPANSITVISSDSLSKIAQASGNAAVNVSVTNPDPITNGGLGSAVAVTQNDVQTLQTTLDQQLQQQANAWLANQVHSGEVAGTPVQMEAPPVATPAAGGTTTDGTFSESVNLHMTVLVVRAADLQAVAQGEFNTAAGRSKANYALAPGQMLSLTQTTSKRCTPTVKATALTLCYTASGLIVPQISVDQIRDSLASRTRKDAKDYLSKVVDAIAGGTTSSVIMVHPDFFPWLPFLSSHITVHVNIVVPKK